MRKSRNGFPSIPRDLRMSPRTRHWQMRLTGGRKTNRRQWIGHERPVFSATLPAVTHGMNQVNTQIFQSEKQPHSGCWNLAIVDRSTLTTCTTLLAPRYQLRREPENAGPDTDGPDIKALKVKGAYSSLWEPISELRRVTCHMGSRTTRSASPPDTSERAPP